MTEQDKKIADLELQVSFYIDEVNKLKTKNEALTEQLRIGAVSQQRELLLAYEIYNASEDDKKNNMKYLENLVDAYLANNCG